MEQSTAPQTLSRVVDVETAASILKDAERVVVFGCSGTGKSTLAQAIATLRQLVYVSMDRDIFWQAGWKLRPRAESIALMEEAVAGERWIIDGNSPSTLPVRLARAQLVIWRWPPRSVAVYGIVRRWLRYRGTVRPEMAGGCPERLNWAFIRYVWTFERDEAPQFEQALALHGRHVPVVVLKSYRDGDRLLAQLRAN